MYYWELKYGDFKDLKSVMIPPDAVATVQRKWDAGQPVHTDRGSIPANQIRSFEQTDKRFSSQPLLETAAQAFHSELLNDDGSVQSKWVKKTVTQDRYQRYYAALPAYRYLKEEGGMAVIAFRLPVHNINQQETQYCDAIEIMLLTK